MNTHEEFENHDWSEVEMSQVVILLDNMFNAIHLNGSNTSDKLRDIENLLGLIYTELGTKDWRQREYFAWKENQPVPHEPYACKIVLTRAQREAIKAKWDQSHDKARNYLEFRRRVMPELGKSGCVMLPWCGMWVGIERDGHAHT